MVNLIFSKERCPLSLSLAGYFMNRGEACIEILDDVQFIISPEDVTSLLFAASNVDTILKNHRPSRIFIQDISKNRSAVTLTSLLNALPIYIIGNGKQARDKYLSRFGASTTSLMSTDTINNFNDTICINNVEENFMYEETISVNSTFPPEPDWFLKHLYYAFEPVELYSLANYALPNYVQIGVEIDNKKRIDAFRTCMFFRSEAGSSWGNFDKIFC